MSHPYINVLSKEKGKRPSAPPMQIFSLVNKKVVKVAKAAKKAKVVKNRF